MDRADETIPCTPTAHEPAAPGTDPAAMPAPASLAGTVRSVNISEKKGRSKDPVPQIQIRPDWGVVGDAHAGDWHRQVSILAWESILRARDLMGLDLQEGSFAENITCEGLDLLALPLGTIVRTGDGVEMELSQIGKVCHTKCAIYHLVGDCIFPREGIFFVVHKGGTVKPGDPIEVVRMGDGVCTATPPEALRELASARAEEAAERAAQNAQR
ncbi:MAG: MOSC domain-containing protein [Eggerthellaceae bacterium]|jgi:MOSC domain-containing protein YiiM